MTLAQRLRTALALPHDTRLLESDMAAVELADDTPPAHAAVLVAITNRAQPGILLTRRTETLTNHAGQVALPGGRIDTGDRDAVAAALREAHEEIALAPDAVDVVGSGDRYRTVTGFVVTPVIGVVAPDLPLRPSPREVDAIFEVPMAHLLDEANFTHASIEWQGHLRHYREMHWQGHRIWGATAAMLVNLARRLNGRW